MSQDHGETSGRWYAAHVLLYVEFLDGVQDYYPVWENIYLLQAQTSGQAFARAEELGQLEESADASSGHTCNGRPARWRFAGVRRLAACIDCEMGPVDGSEVTYLEYTLTTKSALDEILEGRAQVLVLESQEQDGSHPELLGNDLG